MNKENNKRKNMQRKNNNETKKDNLLGNKKYNNKEEKHYNDLLVGKNAVKEALEANKEINKVWIQKGLRGFEKIYDDLRKKQIIISFVDKEKLNKMANNHMGIVASIPPFDYATTEEILNYAKEKGEEPFLLILDKIQDTHNLGAIIRTAVCSGVHGIIIPKRNAASVNSTVVKVSAGATAHIKISRVNNINYEIESLKEKGIWIISTDSNAKKAYYETEYKMPIAVIVGNEEKGVSELTNKNADFKIKIPMVGNFDSLNASVSAGIVCFEVLKQRTINSK